jgi:NRAMP (natural resistance-associated macrophage protein)-like metal ion transporter
MSRIKKFFKILGPGLVTGAADNDPGGIATCAQAGAQFGFAQLWTCIFFLPFLMAVQDACACLGAFKGKGLTYIIAHYYSKKLAYIAILLLLIANTINIGADIGSMAAVTQLIFPVNFTLLVFIYLIFIIWAQIFIKYENYAKFLKWLTLGVLAFPLTMMMINPPLVKIAQATFIPQIEFNYKFLFLITGLLGTTISPYMFFWQASQEVEEANKKNRKKNVIQNNKKELIKTYKKKIHLDTFVGMLLAQVISWSIMAVAGTVLHMNNIMEVKTAADAARMLEPLVHAFPNAGLIAKLIFSIGIIGAGLITIPLLTGSCAYAMCELFNCPRGLDLKLGKGKLFYGTMMGMGLVGILVNYIGIDPIITLVYSAVINGILAVPLLFIIALLARNKKIMKKDSSGFLSQSLLWLTFILMFIAVVSLFVSFFLT